ncbi:MAG: hypothetical protein ABF289_12840 [Clostridiales bacterium]
MFNSMCSSNEAKTAIKNFIVEIENKKKKMDKNFKEMDFENASAKEEMKATINEIKGICDNLISRLKEYKF